MIHVFIGLDLMLYCLCNIIPHINGYKNISFQCSKAASFFFCRNRAKSDVSFQMLLFELKSCAKVRFVCSMGFALNIFSYFVKDSLIYLLQRGVVLVKSTDIAFNLSVGTSLRYQRFLRN